MKKNKNESVHVTVFAYPAASSRLEDTLVELRTVVGVLRHRYEVSATIEVENGKLANPRLSSFLERFLSTCAEVRRYIDPLWLSYLSSVIKCPSEEILFGIESSAGADASFLRPFLLEAIDSCEILRPAPPALFLSTDGLGLRPGQPPWGGCVLEYPFSVAVETTGRRESICHEFLHQFGVSEGYDELTLLPLPGCESCWMQYDSTLGSGLCSRHLTELRTFLGSLETTESTAFIPQV
jgi:hypothetical protein